MIEFRNVTKRYPDGTAAVDDLDLAAPTGEITVLVGPSGCGKTTSLRMINRMIESRPARSWSTVTTSRTVDAAELRRGIGYVIQQAGLFPHRTVLANIATVPRLLGWDKSQAARPRAGTARAGRARRRRWPSVIPSSYPAGSSSGSAWPGRWPRIRR